MPGSLNGASTYFDGSSSVPTRASTIASAWVFTPSMIEPMLPVVSIAIPSVGPAPSSSRSCGSVICALMSRISCRVACSAAPAAASWNAECGESRLMRKSLLIPPVPGPLSNGPP